MLLKPWLKFYLFVGLVVRGRFVNGGVLTITVKRENDIEKTLSFIEDLKGNEVVVTIYSEAFKINLKFKLSKFLKLFLVSKNVI